MDKKKMEELAQDVFDLLNKYNIEARTFTMAIRVSEEYYETMKENYPERHPADIVFGASKQDWAIDMSRPLIKKSRKEDSKEK